MSLFETSKQAPLFCVFFSLGAVLGFLYGAYYLLRKSKVLTVIFDILFSCAYFVLFVLTAYLFNSGKTEPYFFLALISGFFAQRLSIGYFSKKMMDYLSVLMYNLFKRRKDDR